MSDQPHPLESWSEVTPADSMSGMRKSIKANTEAARSSLDWSMRTYEIVLALDKRLGSIESRGDLRTATIAAVVSAAISLVFAACAVAVR